MPIDITAKDNEADTIINLTISGNRLVSLLNSCQSMLFDSGRLVVRGNDFRGTEPAWDELNEIIERMRDKLSEQRCARDKANTSGRNLKD